MKPFWRSKTFWTNIAMLLGSIFIPNNKLDPDIIVNMLVVVNIVLRLISKDKVTLL